MESDKNIVGILRDKDEVDVDGILKTTFGGYTKQSVQEYLSLVHKQQQTTKETFSKNLQTLFDEKEELRKNNETLQARLNKLSSEYDNLAGSLKNIVLDDSEYSAQSVLELKNKMVSLEEQIKVTDRENYSLERKTEQLNNEIDELKTKLAVSIQEYEAQKEMLKSEKLELKKQRDIVADISNKLEEEKNEVKYLKGTVSDGKFAELNSKIGQLSTQLSAQTQVNSKLNEEITLKDKTIDSLNDEVSLLKEKTNNLMKTLQEYNIQNDKLLVANEALDYQLQEEYKKTIALINEKSNITIDRLIAQKNLSVAEAKIAVLEVQLLKTNSSVEVKEEMHRMKTDVSNKEQIKDILSS
jgi:chromosome segregation ATPase